MKVEDLVSVIIPAYNREIYIRDAIKSVYDQVYRPIECIIVDDGSTDKTKNIVSELQLLNDDTFKLDYYYQHNAGAQVARNFGTSKAKGAYIQYLDSDDMLFPSKLTEQVNYLKKNPETDAVWGDWRKGLPEKNDFIKSEASEDLLAQFLAGKGIVIFSFLMRAELVKKLKWDILVRRHQEVDFHLQGLMIGARYEYQSGETGLWRIHDGVRIGNTDGVNALLNYYNKWIHVLSEKKKLSIQIKEAVANLLFWIYTSSQLSHNDAFNLLKQITNLNPNIPFLQVKKMKVLKRIIGINGAIRLWLIKNQKNVKN